MPGFCEAELYLPGFHCCVSRAWVPEGAWWRNSFLSVCPSAAFGLRNYWLRDTSVSFTWNKRKHGVAFSLPWLELQCVKKPKTATEGET